MAHAGRTVLEVCRSTGSGSRGCCSLQRTDHDLSFHALHEAGRALRSMIIGCRQSAEHGCECTLASVRILGPDLPPELGTEVSCPLFRNDLCGSGERSLAPEGDVQRIVNLAQWPCDDPVCHRPDTALLWLVPVRAHFPAEVLNRPGPTDFVLLPLERDQFEARLHMFLRRVGARMEARREDARHRIPLELDPATFTVSVAGATTTLRRAEYTVLACLADRVGHYRTSQEINRALGAHPRSSAARNQIYEVRSRLRDSGMPDIVEYARTQGYRVSPALALVPSGRWMAPRALGI
jgi:hypothetical protein